MAKKFPSLGAMAYVWSFLDVHSDHMIDYYVMIGYGELQDRANGSLPGRFYLSTTPSTKCSAEFHGHKETIAWL